MEESILRSLPPLVQGKLAGVFEFAVEKVKITERIFKNQNSNILVKILWWGETKPLYVRPNKIQFITKDNNEITINEPTEHLVKYEVHTNLKLFKSYLEKCEVVELVVLNSLKNEVIGSTVLRNLIQLVFYTRIFNSSIISHSGDPIGEICCKVSFKEANSKKSPEGIENNTRESLVNEWSASNLKINLNTLNLLSSRKEIDSGSELNKENNSNRDFIEFPIFSKNILDDFHTQRSSNLHYNSPVTQNSDLKFDSKNPGISEYSDKKMELLNDYLKNSSSSHVDSTKAVNINLPMDSERSEKSSLMDSSEGICKTTLPVEPPKNPQANVKEKKRIINKSKNTYLVNKRQEENVNKNKICKIANSKKIINKKPVNSKVKSYIGNKAQTTKNDLTEKALVGSKKNQKSILKCSNVTGNKRDSKITNDLVKPSGNIKSFIKVSKEISKLNKIHLNPSKDSNNDHSDLEKVPVKEDISGGNAKVHDVLENINSEGKESEKHLNMTESCENFKSSQTNTKDYKSEKFDQNKQQSEYPTNLEKINVHDKLHFDLNNPIEKIYYETFFLKTESVCNNEFEIAELLNQPENKYILEGTKGRILSEIDNHSVSEKGDINNQNTRFSSKIDVREDDRTREGILADLPKVRKDKKDYKVLESVTGASQDSHVKSTSEREYKTDCHRCKYYKKLSELDKIIESLKIFETRLKNEVVLSNQSLNTDDNIKNFSDSRQILRRSNHPIQTVKDNKFNKVERSDEEVVLGLDIDGSDFSKEDSDFIEFTHYLSKR